MSRQYYKDSTTGQMKPLGVKVEDTLPVGTEVDYDGTDIPEGWVEVDNILWENSNPTSAFSGQTIILSDDISNYSYYRIIFKRALNTNDEYYSTGFIPVGKGTRLSCPHYVVVKRDITGVSNGKSMIIGDSGSALTYGTNTYTTDNNYNIPTQIIGIR